ncbi:MAG TPA: choice-of-anchor tandem repeat GloVer-containing protein [Terriglobales bacterium]|nr:choice-of-anchor tandem repeat GloVer-containing protein [Terriglobales bacterium]
MNPSMKSHDMTTTNPRNHPTSYRHKLNAALTACALVFALTIIAPGPALAQTYSVIHEFTGGPLGANPVAGMVMDRAGNLYGTTFTGGAGTCPAIGISASGCGTVFEFSPSTGRFTVLYRFTGGTDGAYPQAPLLIAPDGTLYGSTVEGGIQSCTGNYGLPGCGVVFHLQPRPTPPPNATANPWLETPIYSFSGLDGNGPLGDLAMDQSGNIYGSTVIGGLHSYCCGVAFKLTPSNGVWSESTLHQFSGGNDGVSPYGVTLDPAGNVYGTTFQGGNDSRGIAYQLLAGSGWMENQLYSFTGGSDGGEPVSGVTFDSSGNLYGSTFTGGSGGVGTVFELSSGSWAFQLLYAFTQNGSDGGGPFLSDLVLDQAGNVYGTTEYDGAVGGGSVFKLTPSMGGYTYTSLHDFCTENPCPDGLSPTGTLVRDSSGNLYGTTQLGGANSGVCSGSPFGMPFGVCGVIFKITP